MPPGSSLPYFMRQAVIIALTLLLPAFAGAQEGAQSHSPQPRNQLPAPTAEPDNVSSYAPPLPREDEGPTSADRGPAQRFFVLSSTTDNLAAQDDPPRVGNLPADKVAIDRRIKIPLIHDVENDSTYKSGDNHALLYEITYINFGAVTGEQLDARRGHYFTVSWANKGPKADFTARFQYREVKSGPIVRTLTEPMPHVRGTVRSYFGVVGKAYHAYGPVAAWRFTILRGDTVVAETKSFLW
jgi:hypothetical protein